jgi:hypothetical protein
MSTRNIKIINVSGGLVVRVLGYRFGGPGFDSQALQDFPTKKKKKENK